MNCPCCGSPGPCWCSRDERPARPRNTGSPPVYRRPRSHAYSCRCAKCLQSQRGTIETFGIIGPAFAIICVIAAVGWVVHAIITGIT